MAAVWPATLSQYPVVDGYEEAYIENAIHSSMSIGRKNRLRDTNVFKTYKASINVPTSEKSTLKTFWKETIHNGTDAFDWTKFDDTTTPHSYKMLSDPEMTPIAPKLWRVTFNLCDAAPQRTIDTSIVPADAVWPADIPAYSEISGFKEQWNGYALHSGISQGQTARSRGSFTERRISIQVPRMSSAQKQSFESFYEDDTVLGSRTFTHTGWSDDGSSETYVFLSPPKFKAHGAKIFTLNLDLVTI